MELTILMPCLNEVETIVACVESARSFLITEGIDGEVLVSDNGSTDGSQDLAEKHGARITHASRRGYGAALLNGIKEARGKYIIMGDADSSYDFRNLTLFMTKLRGGYDLVMGNRFNGGIEPGAMPFLNRFLGNPVLSFVGRLFFKVPIRDFHCGMRGFNVTAIKKLGLRAQGMEFASEMIVKASLKNLSITEVPTTLSPDGRTRPPHLRKWRDGWRHLRLLLLLSPRWMFLYPGLFFIGFGIILMGILEFGPLNIGIHQLDIHTLLFASTFVVIGFQAVFFSVFGKLIASINMGISINGRLDDFLKNFTLERGIILGLFFVFIGTIGSSLDFYIWMHSNFGKLIPRKMMRITIPSITMLIIGMQTIFSSFFMNLIITHTDFIEE